MQFGRKSEKTDRRTELPELRLEHLQTDEGATALKTRKQRPNDAGKRTGRKRLPEHIPREDNVHLPDDVFCRAVRWSAQRYWRGHLEKLE